MNIKNIRLLLLAAAMIFVSCSDDELNPYDKNTGGSSDGGINANANITTVCRYANRLEFPRLKNNGSSQVLVNTTGDAYDPQGVNYCVEWDSALKSQRWSCYQMRSGFSKKGISRYYASDGEMQYPWDPRLVNGDTYLNDDYFWSSGYDHGHICPSADRLYSTSANYQTFYLTNMQPQRNKFNAGIWAKLEGQIRTWTNAKGTEVIYVCKGGTIDNESNIIERIKGKLIVPKYFYTALLLKNAMGYRAIAFWFENVGYDQTNENLGKFAISVDELERRTGIDFFCNLPDDTEEDRESRCDLAAWGMQ